jgi:hypothetical protein
MVNGGGCKKMRDQVKGREKSFFLFRASHRELKAVKRGKNKLFCCILIIKVIIDSFFCFSDGMSHPLALLFAVSFLFRMNFYHPR